MRTINHITVYLLIITALLLALVGYWLVYPQKVMVIENPMNVKLDKTVYQKGERITYELHYCKYQPYTATVLRTLVNSIRISYTEMRSDLAVGCGTIHSSDLQIPEFAEVGRYHIETTMEYKINPLRTEKITWRSQEFDIVPSKTTEEIVKQLQEKDIELVQ